MLKILTVVKQSLKRWKTHQRDTRHLVVNTWVLKKKRWNVETKQRNEGAANFYILRTDQRKMS